MLVTSDDSQLELEIIVYLPLEIFQFLPSCPPQLEQWSSNSLLTLIIIKHVPGLRPGRGQPYTGQGDSSQLRRLLRGWCSPIVPVCRGRWRLHFSLGVYFEWLGKSVDNVISQGWRRCDVCWSDINIWQQMAAIHHRSPYRLQLNTVNTPSYKHPISHQPGFTRYQGGIM